MTTSRQMPRLTPRREADSGGDHKHRPGQQQTVEEAVPGPSRRGAAPRSSRTPARCGPPPDRDRGHRGRLQDRPGASDSRSLERPQPAAPRPGLSLDQPRPASGAPRVRRSGARPRPLGSAACRPWCSRAGLPGTCRWSDARPPRPGPRPRPAATPGWRRGRRPRTGSALAAMDPTARWGLSGASDARPPAWKMPTAATRSPRASASCSDVTAPVVADDPLAATDKALLVQPVLRVRQASETTTRTNAHPARTRFCALSASRSAAIATLNCPESDQIGVGPPRFASPVRVERHGRRRTWTPTRRGRRPL